MDSKNGSKIRIVEHLLSFAVHQSGEGVTGKHYRERRDGERISSWEVETEILHRIIRTLNNIYQRDNSLSSLVLDDMAYPYLEQSLSLLNPWMINLDSDPSDGIDNLSKEQIDSLLYKLFLTEQNMAAIATNGRQFDLAEKHLQRCLAYSRRYGLEGENNITMIYTALRTYCILWEEQGNLSDAVIFAEECYNLVVEGYDPVHPQVQEAAGLLIHILIKKDDLFDAERYTQVTYGNLRDKKNGINQESEMLAMESYKLANVIFERKGDFLKAEELVRESLQIRSRIFDSNYQSVGRSWSLLTGILKAQGKLGDETRGFYERYLTISFRNEGPDGLNTAIANYNYGDFSIAVFNQLACEQTTIDLKQPPLLLAKSYYEESHRIFSKINGPTHPNTVKAASRLAVDSNKLSRFSLP
jgi:hypothetical protein